MAIVYLHIGAPKTATSTLQYVMAHNRKKMLKAGVLYPGSIMHGNAHHALVCDLLEKHRSQVMPDIWYGTIPRGQSWELLKTEISQHQSSVDRIVLSSELFFGQIFSLDLMLRDITKNLQEHNIRVVVYLRRQDQLYSSFYNQDVKGIRQWGQSAYQFYQTHQIFEHGYHAVLDMWCDVFGKSNVIIRPFEAEQWQDFDILKDFGSVIGNVSLPRGKAQNNDSLGMIQLYIKRCLNKVGFKKQDNDEVVRILYELCPEAPTKGCQYVHRSLYRKFRETWLEDNRVIAEQFLAGRELFSQTIPAAEEVAIYELNRMGVALYAQNMFNQFEKGRFRKFRQLFSKATLLVLSEQNLWNALDAQSRSIMLEWATAIDK